MIGFDVVCANERDDMIIYSRRSIFLNLSILQFCRKNRNIPFDTRSVAYSQIMVMIIIITLIAELEEKSRTDSNVISEYSHLGFFLITRKTRSRSEERLQGEETRVDLQKLPSSTSVEILQHHLDPTWLSIKVGAQFHSFIRLGETFKFHVTVVLSFDMSLARSVAESLTNCKLLLGIS